MPPTGALPRDARRARGRVLHASGVRKLCTTSAGRSRPARELREVPPELLGRVAEQALEGHEFAKVRVPPPRVIHAAAPVVLLNGVNLAEDRAMHAVIDRPGMPLAEDDGLSARPERVGTVEERCGEVDHPRERAGVTT